MKRSVKMGVKGFGASVKGVTKGMTALVRKVGRRQSRSTSSGLSMLSSSNGFYSDHTRLHTYTQVHFPHRVPYPAYSPCIAVKPSHPSWVVPLLLNPRRRSSSHLVTAGHVTDSGYRHL